MKRIFCALLAVLFSLAGVYSVSAQITNMEIMTSEGQCLILRPSASSNLVLQSATDLVASNWTAVTDGTAVTAIAVPRSVPTRFFRLYNPASSANFGMLQIPSGYFQMGDTLYPDTTFESDNNVVTNYVSAFSMDTNVVSYSQWQSVYSYATNLGYSFTGAATAKATNHPIVNVDWYDCVKWCNARSQKAGLPPMYYTDAGLTQVYTNGETDNVFVNWGANGYRLPTEAEWEKAARGGVTGQRYPFGMDINETLANYVGFTGATGGYPFDTGPNGYNATYATGSTPYTSPVGAFAPNGYGLCDMAGNVFEWCWDWSFPSYTAGTDPTGPVSGSNRIFRAGSWGNDASGCRCARRWSTSPNSAGIYFGFRCVARF